MSIQITDYFEPERGPSVISVNGLQKYTESLDSYSQIYSSISVDGDNGKYSIDSCWESGDIYFCNYGDGAVKKIRFDGTELFSMSLINPSGLSVIQFSSEMQSTVTFPPQEDRGVWIHDAGSNKLIKTDNSLGIISETSGVSNVVGLISTTDGGCFVVTQNGVDGSVIMVKSDGRILASSSFSSFTPSVSYFRDLSIDKNDRLFVLANDLIYCLEYQDGSISQALTTLDPLGGGSDSHIGAIDVDRNDSQKLYVAGGNNDKAFVMKYDSAFNFIDDEDYIGLSYPYIIKVVQGLGSEWLYILEDSDKWDYYGYGSSSSSSSSSVSSNSSSSSSV